jgi:hypothetical protein
VIWIIDHDCGHNLCSFCLLAVTLVRPEDIF